MRSSRRCFDVGSSNASKLGVRCAANEWNSWDHKIPDTPIFMKLCFVFLAGSIETVAWDS